MHYCIKNTQQGHTVQHRKLYEAMYMGKKLKKNGYVYVYN